MSACALKDVCRKGEWSEEGCLSRQLRQMTRNLWRRNISKLLGKSEPDPTAAERGLLRGHSLSIVSRQSQLPRGKAQLNGSGGCSGPFVCASRVIDKTDQIRTPALVTS